MIKDSTGKPILATYIVPKLFPRGSTLSITIDPNAIRVTNYEYNKVDISSIVIDIDKEYSTEIKEVIDYLVNNCNFLKTICCIPVVRCYCKFELPNLFKHFSLNNEDWNGLKDMLDILFNNYLSDEDKLKMELSYSHWPI